MLCLVPIDLGVANVLGKYYYRDADIFIAPYLTKHAQTVDYGEYVHTTYLAIGNRDAKQNNWEPVYKPLIREMFTSIYEVSEVLHQHLNQARGNDINKYVFKRDTDVAFSHSSFVLFIFIVVYVL